MLNYLQGLLFSKDMAVIVINLNLLFLIKSSVLLIDLYRSRIPEILREYFYNISFLVTD